MLARAFEVAQRTADVAEDLVETTRKLAEESPEVGQAFTELLGEQTRQSVDTFSAFARAVNWTDVARLSASSSPAASSGWPSSTPATAHSFSAG